MPERDPKRFPHKVGDIYYSDKKVLQSGAGFYIGTTCWDTDMGGFEDMGSRESGYFATREEAEKALKSGEFEERDCMENESAYEQGLPKPETKPVTQKPTHKKTPKPRFRIGDYVEVKATTEAHHRDKFPPDINPAKHFLRPVCIKVLVRNELRTGIRGWIVGMVRRFEGEVSPARGGGTEDYESGYLGVTGSVLLWKVAQSMTNIPLEVADADVVLVAKPNTWTHQYLDEKKHEWTEIPKCPLKLGASWDTAGWSKDDQRKEMQAWPRDAKGHWLKKPKK